MSAAARKVDASRKVLWVPSPDAVVVAWTRTSDEHNSADLLLARTVASVLGVSPTDFTVSRLCPSCGSAAHGRPLVLSNSGPGAPFVSLARADDLIVVAISTAGPVGIDVERVDAPAFCGFDEVALHERERARTVRERAITWTRKESLLKATGHGLRIDPRQLEMSAPIDPPRLLQWAAPHPPTGEPWLADLSLDPDFVTCVTVLGVASPQLSVQAAVQAEPPR